MSNQGSAENICVVCFRPAKYFSIGNCDHAVCFECSTRMRVLCKQNECPICRAPLPEVYFSNKIKPFSDFSRLSLHDNKYNIYFVDEASMEAYLEILDHSCKFCDETSFPTFTALRDHIKRVHQLFYCDLCVHQLKLFTFERRCYNRTDLATHRRKGDIDDKSHRGHPLCEFCDERFMDKDELFRHLRKEHLYCHFCDADGVHMFYKYYSELQDHFREQHFLCEEDDCKNERFTSAFATEIDLKAHFTQYHKSKLNKFTAKAMKTIDVDFNVNRKGPRDKGFADNKEFEREFRGNSNRGNSRRQRSPMLRFEEDPCRIADFGAEEPVQVSAPVVPELDSVAQFPALGDDISVRASGVAAQDSMANRVAKQNSISTKLSTPYGKKNVEEEFPLLVPSRSAPSAKLGPKIVHPYQKSNKSVMRTKAPSKDAVVEDFPALVCDKTYNLPNSAPIVAPTSYSSSVNSHPVAHSRKKEKINPPDDCKNEFLNNPSEFPTLSIPTASRNAPVPKNNKQLKKFEKPGDFIHQNVIEKKERTQPQRTQKNSIAHGDQKVEERKSSGPSSKKENPTCLSTQPKVVGPPPGFQKLAVQDGISHTQSDNNQISDHSNNKMVGYIKPKGFHDRNQNLIHKIRSLLDRPEMMFLRFKTLSQDFRNDGKSAREYYQECSEILGTKGFSEVFPELIALLPDINKQQDLLKIHKKLKRDVSRLSSCSDCRQVLKSVDMSEHKEIHKKNAMVS